ncbi:MAG TPA: MoaD/ThiS family protein [Planctomycetota bacterium]|nr:MoaD/ThiS family protein [Planctomycetota bacterium]
MTVVHVPSPLHSYTNDRGEVEAEGATLQAILEDLDRRYPGFRFRVVDEQGRIRPTLLFYVNGQVTRTLAQAVAQADEVHIIAALSGG